MKVVVICENLRHDEFILRPIIKQLFKELDIKRVRIVFSSSKLIEGVDAALKLPRLKKVFARYREADAFFLIVDRDGKANREKRIENRLKEAGDMGIRLFGCLAEEAAEIWALALHRRELGVDWEKVRSERDVKESFFHPFARRKGWDPEGLGKGREEAMRDIHNKWNSLKSLCPEIQQLVDDVRDWLQSQD